MRPRIKICGLTRPEDARMARELGTDYFGVVLYPASPRHVPARSLTGLVAAIPSGQRVAVHVTPEPAELQELRTLGFDFFQVHYDPVEVADAVLTAWKDAVGADRLWLAPRLPPRQEFPPAALKAAHTLLLDTYQQGTFGGSGRTGDWSHFRGHGVGLTMGLHPTQLISAMGIALIAVFWAYDGWVYITWVAGEVKEPRRNVPLAMVLGVIVVGAIYMAMNVTYLYALPLTEIAKHETIAHAAATALFSPHAAVWLSLMIAVSCFSAAATCTLSGARVYLAMAQDGVFFKRMAVIHPKWRTPAFSLIGQGIWAALLTVSGRYDQLYTYVIYGMVLSYTLTVIGMFLLRWKRPEIPRPYRCTGYPWLPAIYVLVGTAWTLNTILTRPTEAFWGTAIVLVGVPGYLY